MKLLYFITKSNWGGAQRNVYDLATAMKEAGHDVSVALGGDGTLRKNLESAGIYTHSISSLGRDVNASKEFQSLKEIVSVIRHRRPDVMHLHSPKAAGLGAVAGRLFGVKKIVYTVHGWAFNEDRSLLQKTIIAFFSWITMMLCHKVIILSEKEYVQTLHFPWVKKKLSLIPLGIRPPVFISVDGAKHAVSRQIGMNYADFSKKTVIGTIAELHRNKGLSYLINALVTVTSENPSAICVVIGDGEDRNLLTSLIDTKGLKDKVFLAGYMDNAAEYLKAFNIFVLPSVKEGLPYCILEAGCASLPVVSTTVGGIPEIIEDMKSGILVQPKNQKELSHAISFMLEHPDERRKYGNSLKERIYQQFSLQKMITSTSAEYLE